MPSKLKLKPLTDVELGYLWRYADTGRHDWKQPIQPLIARACSELRELRAMQPKPFNQVVAERLDRGPRQAAERGESMMCEKCWHDAWLAMLHRGGTVTDRYSELLAERKDNPCCEHEQRGYVLHCLECRPSSASIPVVVDPTIPPGEVRMGNVRIINLQPSSASEGSEG